VEYGTKVLHRKYGEGLVIREQIGIIEVHFKEVGIVAVNKDELTILDGIF
jgi:hypothetical protein